MAGGDRGLQHVDPVRVEGLGPRERGQGVRDEGVVPAAAVLVEQQDGLPRGATRACRREAWISISATRPCTPDSSGINPAMMRPRRRASWHSAGRTQSSPVVAVRPDESFVVTWKSAGQDGDSYGIYGQRYAGSNLVKAGSEFRMNPFIPGAQTAPSVAWLGTGGLVAAWQTVGEDEDTGATTNAAIKAQNFNSDGSANLPDYVANITSRDRQTVPRVAGFPAGSGYVMVWQSNLQDGSGNGVIGRLFQ